MVKQNDRVSTTRPTFEKFDASDDKELDSIISFKDGLCIWWNQFSALMVKNIYALCGEKLTLLFMFLVPALIPLVLSGLESLYANVIRMQLQKEHPNETFGDDWLLHSKLITQRHATILLVMLAFPPMCLATFIGPEKRSGVLGLLRMAGLRESTYWLSWYICFVCALFIVALFYNIMGLAVAIPLFNNTSFMVHTLLAWSYMLYTLTIMMLFLSFTRTTRSVSIMQSLLLLSIFGGYVVFSIIGKPMRDIIHKDANNIIFALMAIVPYLPFAYALETIIASSYTSYDDGTNAPSIVQAQPYTLRSLEELITDPTQPGNQFDFSASFMLLFLCGVSIIYGILSWYMAQVAGGAHQPWYFVVSPSYWCPKVKTESICSDELGALQTQSQRDQSVILHQLSKHYKNSSAVAELSLRMASNKVFCLLGPNGAGKSSMIGMLSGLVKPTHGEAFIFGYDVRSSMAHIQRLMGVCMQDDVLFQKLTGGQNLLFWCRFRGVPTATVDRLLHGVDLVPARNKSVCSYSGGMKRRLSVACALVSKPKLIFLDEPTTGLDPHTRKRVWNTIQEFKQNAVVIMTTHSMEEADILGDRIAIIENGRLRAVGTSMQLKDQFGSSCHINIEVAPEKREYVLGKVNQILPEVRATAVGSHISFGLPKSSIHLAPHFLRFLEEENEKYGAETGVVDWSVRHTMLEEVFRHIVGAQKAVFVGEMVDANPDTYTMPEHTPYTAPESIGRGNPAAVSQVRALLYKSATLQAKQRKANCCRFSCLFLTVALIVGLSYVPGPSKPTGIEQGKLNQIINLLCLFLPFCSMLFLPTMVSQLVSEHAEYLVVLMRMHSMKLRNYLASIYCWYFILYFIVMSIFTVLVALFVDTESNISYGWYVLLTLLWFHAQCGTGLLLAAFLARSSIATRVSYLYMLASSIAASNIYVVQVNLAEPHWGNSIYVPSLAFIRGYVLLLDGTVARGELSELRDCLLILLLGGTLMLLVGGFVLMFIGDELSPMQQLFDRLRTRSFNSQPQTDVEADVLVERQRVESQEDPLCLRHVYKQYGRKGTVAVQDLTIGVQLGECFGLLGKNGAGKTSAISMISGATTITSGTIHVASHNAASEASKVHGVLGVCPQFDHVFRELSVEDHLLLYARLKGVPIKTETILVRHVAKMLNLDGDAYRKLASELSGGMRRRLSIALAMLTLPKVLLLDEPTTGTDPETRRDVWKTLLAIKKDRVVVLTTHSMEEADVLCDRIGIMARGSLKCLGSSSRLKSKFGRGYLLKVATTNHESVTKLVQAMVPISQVTREDEVLSFVIPNRRFLLPQIFESMESLKQKLEIDFWSCGQPSLDEVFIHIAENSINEELAPSGSSYTIQLEPEPESDRQAAI